MTEEEYLNATNRSNITAAIHALRECTFLDADDEVDRCKAVGVLWALEDRLTSRIQVTKTPSAPATEEK